MKKAPYTITAAVFLALGLFLRFALSGYGFMAYLSFAAAAAAVFFLVLRLLSGKYAKVTKILNKIAVYAIILLAFALAITLAMLIADGKTGYMSSVRNTTAPASEWVAGGIPITAMMNMERRNGEMKPVIRKALVELDGAPFKAFAAQRDEWAKETCYVYPGPIQYFGPSEVCDQTTKTLQYEQAR